MMLRTGEEKINMSISKKITKKIAAFVLAMVMVLAILPGRGVFADDDPNVKYYKIDNEWIGFNPVTQTLTGGPIPRKASLSRRNSTVSK